MSGRTGLLVAVLVAVLVAATRPQPFHDRIFAAYEYTGPGNHLFHPRGVTEAGIVVDDSLWTIDWPEDPDSILAVLTYADWNARSPLDLRGKSAVIRWSGDLALHGAHVTFWILADGNRWHHTEPVAQETRLDLSGT